MIWYLFKFSEEPYTRWINEKDANMYPSIMNEYLCQNNYNQNLNFQPHECRVVKDKHSLNKKKTRGLLIMMFSCGVCINLEEMISSESLTQIANLLKLTTELIKKQINYVVYDNACHIIINNVIYLHVGKIYEQQTRRLYNFSNRQISFRKSHRKLFS